MGYVTNQGGGGGDFLRVVNGKLVKRVEEGTEGAIKRDYTVLATGEKKSVWELHYPGFEGKITKCAINELEHGQVLEIVLDDGSERATISIPFPGRLADSFIQRVPNIDLSKPVLFNAGLDKERNTNFIWLKQDGASVKSTFTKNDPNGCPEMVKKVVAGKVKWDGEARTDFLYNHLKDWTEKNGLATISPEPTASPEPNTANEDDDVPF